MRRPTPPRPTPPHPTPPHPTPPRPTPPHARSWGVGLGVGQAGAALGPGLARTGSPIGLWGPRGGFLEAPGWSFGSPWGVGASWVRAEGVDIETIARKEGSRVGDAV